MIFSRVFISGFSFLLSILLLASCNSEPTGGNERSPTSSEIDDANLSSRVFSLTKVSGDTIQFSIPSEGFVVLEWFNQACPFVKKFYKDSFMQNLQTSYREKGVKWYMINSTNSSHKDFLSPEKRAELVSDWNLDSPSLMFDEEGVLGKSLSAKTTPQIFIFKDGKLIYKGAVDDTPDTDSDPLKAKNFISDLIDNYDSKSLEYPIKNRPYGCSIKY